MKKTIIYWIMIILGMLLISFPIISNYINTYKQTIVMSNYQEDVKKLPKDEKQQELLNAQNYNDKLEQSTAIDISLDTNKNEKDTEYINVLNIGNIMGYISIPKIDVYFPIYHGISENVLQSGVGHIEKSSLPIGGKNTHAVLAGHSGLARIKIFDDLNKLCEGDLFYIYVLDKTLAYKVDRIDIVSPDDTETIKTYENEDYVTLVTCTPRILNTNRLLVRGTRVEETNQFIEIYDNGENYRKIEKNNDDLDFKELKNNNIKKICLSITILFFIFIIIVLIVFGKKNK